MLGLLQDLLNGGPLWILALFGGLVLMPWLIEARPLMEGWSWRKIVPAALAFAALAWVPAALAPAYSADRQQQWTTQYVLEAGKPPRWSIVNDRKPLPSTFDRFGSWTQGQLPISRRLRWTAAAPAQPGFAQPGGRSAERRADDRQPPDRPPAGPDQRGQRHRTRFSQGRCLPRGRLRARIAPGREGGRRLLQPDLHWRSCDGQVATIVTGPEPLDLRVTGTHWRLPPAAAPLLAAKPNMPSRNICPTRP
jgi:hypothetical protein